MKNKKLAVLFFSHLFIFVSTMHGGFSPNLFPGDPAVSNGSEIEIITTQIEVQLLNDGANIAGFGQVEILDDTDPFTGESGCSTPMSVSTNENGYVKIDVPILQESCTMTLRGSFGNGFMDPFGDIEVEYYEGFANVTVLPNARSVSVAIDLEFSNSFPAL